MVELITRDIPFIRTVSAKDLNAADRFMLEKVHKVSVFPPPPSGGGISAWG